MAEVVVVEEKKKSGETTKNFFVIVRVEKKKRKKNTRKKGQLQRGEKEKIIKLNELTNMPTDKYELYFAEEGEFL